MNELTYDRCPTARAEWSIRLEQAVEPRHLRFEELCTFTTLKGIEERQKAARALLDGAVGARLLMQRFVAQLSGVEEWIRCLGDSAEAVQRQAQQVMEALEAKTRPEFPIELLASAELQMFLCEVETSLADMVCEWTQGPPSDQQLELAERIYLIGLPEMAEAKGLRAK